MAAKPKAKSSKQSLNNQRDRDRLLDFFLKHPNQVYDNATLAKNLGGRRGDSWTRRLRELREPRFGGYTIHTQRDRKTCVPDSISFRSRSGARP